MLNNASACLFETERVAFQLGCHELAGDLLENNLASQNELNSRIGQIQLTLDRLRRAGQMMAIDCPTSELIHVVSVGFFNKIVERSNQVPMTEFDWACLYTQDTLNMLAADFLHTTDRTVVARHLENQAMLWDLRLPFPPTLSGTDFVFSSVFESDYQIPPAAHLGSASPQYGWVSTVIEQ